MARRCQSRISRLRTDIDNLKEPLRAKQAKSYIESGLYGATSRSLGKRAARVALMSVMGGKGTLAPIRCR